MLAGYTLGAALALQYGLDYPDEVKGLVLRTVAARPKVREPGTDDPGNPPDYEQEIHEAVPGSRYVRLSGAGHFPPTEKPDEVNALLEEFVAAL